MMVDQVEEDDWTVHDDYAIQYFGFHPQTLFNGMYNVIWEYTKEGMSALNENVLSTFDRVSETELQEVSKQQKKIAMDRLNAKFDKAECYLHNNVFQIPKHIVLPEDKGKMEHPCSQEDMHQLDGELKHVVDQIIAVKYANTQLQERLKVLGDVQQHFDTTLSDVDQINCDVSKQAQDTMYTMNSFQQVETCLNRSNSDSNLI